jgi:hypothetical protein
MTIRRRANASDFIQAEGKKLSLIRPQLRQEAWRTSGLADVAWTEAQRQIVGGVHHRWEAGKCSAGHARRECRVKKW